MRPRQGKWHDGWRYFAPGERGDNRHWIIRGNVNGKRKEKNTGCTDQAAARRYAEGYRRQCILDGAQPKRGEFTFVQGLDRWLAGGQRSRNDERYCARLKAWAGPGDRSMPSASTKWTGLPEEIYPGASAATVNRQVYAVVGRC